MKKIVLFFIGLLTCAGSLFAQEENAFVKTTHEFSVKGNETLYLDRYAPAIRIDGEKSPCIIFVFGGAFARGARDAPKYILYFDYLVRDGYTVISIDYRLGLKNAATQSSTLSQEAFAGLFIKAVDMAVEDLFDATRFVIDHTDEWNIDTGHIVANGSSAGAVTVLQAEYALSNGTYNVASKLPAGFRYAGIISFAGAIFVDKGDLQWGKEPCPIMMMHGDADLQVPFSTLSYEGMGFYGPEVIAETLKEKEYPYYFCKFDDYGHEIASDPMRDNKEDVLWFLHTLVRDQKLYQVFKEQKEIGRPIREKNFGFQDFVKGNFGQ
ncbi:MAG: carboxylesterase family protein [Bacteroides sp.]|nr:carboxylesterase family protein [Bacteroides sp.]